MTFTPATSPSLARHTVLLLLSVVLLAASASACSREAAASPAPIRLQIEPGLSGEAVAACHVALSAASGVAVQDVDENPDLVLTGDPGDRLAYERIFVPVDRFSTLLSSVSLPALAAVWRGDGTSPDYATLYPDAGIVPDLTVLLGPPGPAVKPLPREQVVNAVWNDSLGLGLLAFDSLTPRLRALPLDNESALSNRFQPEQWPLAARTWLRAATPRATQVLRGLPERPLTNRDPDRLTVLLMTGTTALARGTAAAIEQAADFAFPARIIGPDLATADLVTVSNEASFVAGCEADNRRGVALFCARPEYFATLELSGAKLVGLTGNHLNDFGTAGFLKTLDFYREHRVSFYGGGANDQAARAPVFVEHHGNRLAFLGANQFGPAELRTNDGSKVSAWAAQDTPGAARYDAEAMAKAVGQAGRTADLVFAELQWLETNEDDDYQTEPVLGQREGFRQLADAGATVVTGMQAHAPQSVELRGQALILYGLGNLYFDQSYSLQTRTGLIARHTIYDHRLINTELLVTYIQDNMQVRWATPNERVQILRAVFLASGW